jgi:dolichol-phosphate mannosyltransferase
MSTVRENTGPLLSVIVPTFNEEANIAEVVRRLGEALADIAWEVIFVDDDSPDGTAALVRRLSREDSRVRVVHRVNRRGLSTACVEGMLASSAPFLAVMDADLQHDERILPDMLDAVMQEGLDLAVGSRYVEGGSMGDWSRDRQAVSRIATGLSRLVLKADLRDPMSGFFLMRRELLEEVVYDLSAIGFKILVDIFASAKRPLHFREIPYRFRARQAGESKLDGVVAWEYVTMLLDKSLGRYIPIRFIPFALIGGVGVFVHMAVLWVVFLALGKSFVAGQTAATLVAMTTNFFMNNMFTYRDRRLRGWDMLRGWVSFTLACSVGAVANVGIATYLFETRSLGDLGWVFSAAAGILVGAVWNYAVTSVYTWNKPKTV